MKPTLPRDDPHPKRRAAQVEEAAAQRRYTYDRFTNVATDVARPPVQSAQWLAQYVAKALETTANSKRVNERVSAAAGRPSFRARIRELLTTDVADLPELVAQRHLELAAQGERLKQDVEREGIGWVFDEMNSARAGSPLDVPATSARDFEALFVSIEAPGVAASYADDAVFARMRLAGPNPMMIERLTAADPRFPVTNEQFQAVMGEWDDLDRAMDEGRVYLEDLTSLAGAPTGKVPHGQKYVSAPLAMFAVPRGEGEQRALRPIAIQCEPKPGPGNPVFTPADGVAWLMAKVALTVADGNMHQAVSHLGQTHLVMPAFILATERNLAQSHPLRALLASHFEGTLGINKMADEVLCKPGGGVDSMLACTIEGSRELAARAAREWHFNSRMLPNELEARGVDDAACLPDYPYRDDGLLVWDAIHAWVTDFVGIYYASDDEVVADPELAAWAREIAATDGGRVRGFGQEAPGEISGRAYLADAVTQIIFTAGPQHSAVNFSQYEHMSFMANYPLAMYRPAPTKKSGYEISDYLAMLPTLDMAQYQLNFGYLMGTLRYLTLGQYGQTAPFCILHDERVCEALATFQANLVEVERVIRGRNAMRPAYSYLLPSLITHSLNI